MGPPGSSLASMGPPYLIGQAMADVLLLSLSCLLVTVTFRVSMVLIILRSKVQISLEVFERRPSC